MSRRYYYYLLLGNNLFVPPDMWCEFHCIKLGHASDESKLGNCKGTPDYERMTSPAHARKICKSHCM